MQMITMLIDKNCVISNNVDSGIIVVSKVYKTVLVPVGT